LIPRAHVTAWRIRAPWPSNEQVEQDLVLSRALVSMFQQPTVAELAAFRGGTALHKLFFTAPGRYSEDIDLVQRDPGPIGELIGAIRSSLDPWLGEPRWKQGQGRFTLVYRFTTTFEPVSQMRMKIEINTREHFTVLGLERRAFVVENPWFQGSTELPVYELDEMLGTKMRALFQRRKGRDLFDLWLASERAAVDAGRVVECFRRYLEHEGQSVSRAEFEANLREKLADPRFGTDIEPLIAPGTHWSIPAAGELVLGELASRLPGGPWKGAGASSGR
jgi:predicted nucleotidyltransferase component of viral defense system